MELANQPQLQEMLPRQISSLCPSYSAIGAVSLPAQAVFVHVALVSFCLFQLLQHPSASGRESGPETRGEAVVFSCLFQRSLARDRESDPECEESPARSQ